MLPFQVVFKYAPWEVFCFGFSLFFFFVFNSLSLFALADIVGHHGRQRILQEAFGLAHR